jgi:hypothetical protein
VACWQAEFLDCWSVVKIPALVDFGPVRGMTVVVAPTVDADDEVDGPGNGGNGRPNSGAISDISASSSSYLDQVAIAKRV